MSSNRRHTTRTSGGRSASTSVSEFTHNRFVLTSLVSKDFKLKYRRSVLGVLWSVLNPLLMMIVLTFVFSNMFRFQIENYPLYVILGNTLFAIMQNGSSAGMGSILGAASMIKKIRIEKMIFPLEKVLFELVNFAISLIAVALVMAYLQVAPSISILMLPVLLIYVTLFTTGLALLLSALATFFRDVIHLWGVVCLAWTYATPLFWPADINSFPEDVRATLAPLLNLEQFNPMYQFVTYFRDIVMWNTMPSLKMNLICFGMAAITFAVGFIVFRKTQDKFILYV